MSSELVTVLYDALQTARHLIEKVDEYYEHSSPILDGHLAEEAAGEIEEAVEQYEAVHGSKDNEPDSSEEKEYKCCLCQQVIETQIGGWNKGHNPWPMTFAGADSRCCESCNVSVVVPARISILMARKNDIFHKQKKSNKPEYIGDIRELLNDSDT